MRFDVIEQLSADAERVTKSWDWWNAFLQSQYYGGSDEVVNWNLAEQSVVESTGLQPGTSVLELGCGSGELLFRLAARGIHARGIDSSKPLIDYCRSQVVRRGIPCRFDAVDMFEFAPTDTYDCILCINTSFGYGSDEQNRELIGKVADWLNVSGTFYLDLVVADDATSFGTWSDSVGEGTLIVRNRYDEENQTMISWPFWYRDSDNLLYDAPEPEVVRLYTQQEIAEMLERAGLTWRTLPESLGRKRRMKGSNRVETFLARRPPSSE